MTWQEILFFFLMFGGAPLVAWKIAKDLRSGVTVFRGGKSTRSEEPFGFWLNIAFMIVAALIFAVGGVWGVLMEYGIYL